MKIKPIFAWYDFWIGIFIDREKKCLYFFPVPMFGVKISYRELWKRLIPHYLIIGEYTKEPIGCTLGESGKRDVLEEEPGATFKKCPRKKCPICGENR